MGGMSWWPDPDIRPDSILDDHAVGSRSVQLYRQKSGRLYFRQLAYSELSKGLVSLVFTYEERSEATRRTRQGVISM